MADVTGDLFDATKNWQPIGEAPRDCVVLTDSGTARYLDKDHYGDGHAIISGWYLCESSDDIPACAENGIEISRVEPSFYMLLPPRSLMLTLEERKRYQAGGSHLFALVAHSLIPSTLKMAFDREEKNAFGRVVPVRLVHAWIELPDGRCLDSSGIITRETLDSSKLDRASILEVVDATPEYVIELVKQKHLNPFNLRYYGNLPERDRLVVALTAECARLGIEIVQDHSPKNAPKGPQP